MPTSRATLPILLVLASLTVAVGALIAPNLPKIAAAFADTPGADLQSRLVLTLPALFIALGAGPAGWSTDRIGRRPTLLATLVLYVAAGSAGLWVTTLSALLASRAVLGLAVAGVSTVSSAMLADLYEGPARQRAIGLQSVVMSGGGIAYATVGGMLGAEGWRAPFAVYLAAALLLPLTWWAVPEPRLDHDAARRDDRTAPWGTLLLLDALGSLGMCLFYLVPAQIAFLLQGRLGLGPESSGLAIAACTLPSLLIAVMFRRLVTTFDHRALLVATFAFVAPGFFGISVAPTLPALLLALFVAGCGFGLLIPNLGLWQSELAPATQRGRVLGLMTLGFFSGQFSSPLLVHQLGDTLDDLVLAYQIGSAAAATAAIFVLAVWKLAPRALPLTLDAAPPQ